MILKVTDDKKFLIVDTCTFDELNQLQYSLTKKMSNWYIMKKKYPNMNTDITFIDQYKRIPIGLYKEVIKIGKKYNFPVYIQDYQTTLISNRYNEEDFDKWIEDFFQYSPKIKPRYYQIDAVKAALKYEFGHEEISTSGGKTLIAYILFKYLNDRKLSNRMLYIVPNLNLVTQSEEKFYSYTEDCEQPINFTTATIYGGSKIKEPDTNIVFGTFQSLSKKSDEYFQLFDTVLVDECLHPNTLITMYDNSKKYIKDVNIGDKVFTINDKTGEKEVHEVEYVYKNLSKDNQMYEIETDNGEILNITGNHKVLTKNLIWKRVDELTLFDNILCDKNKFVYITHINKIDYKDDVYNLRIKCDDENNHNYIANGLCVSNCHHTVSASIRKIISKCYNARIRIGLTGTMPLEDTLDSYTIQSYLGPLIYKLESNTLIEEGNATPIKVTGIEMDYLDEDIKEKLYKLRNVPGDEKDSIKILNLERTIVRTNKKRFDYITKIIGNVTKNSLVLFNDVQNNYGRNIYNYLKENTEHSVYYIDGGSSDEVREYAKNQMENGDDVIIVASTGTFSEGIDISNIHNIFVVESNKSEFIVRQILGRGMRLKSGKEYVTLVDFIDNFEYGSGHNRTNYMIKHANERERIYKSKKFPYSRIKVKI